MAKPAQPRTGATPRSDNAVQSDSGFNYISRDKLSSLPEWVAHADTVFMQVGDDLMIVSSSGEILMIDGYFTGETPPELRTISGEIIIPELDETGKTGPPDTQGIVTAAEEEGAFEGNIPDDNEIAEADELPADLDRDLTSPLADMSQDVTGTIEGEDFETWTLTSAMAPPQPEASERREEFSPQPSTPQPSTDAPVYDPSVVEPDPEPQPEPQPVPQPKPEPEPEPEPEPVPPVVTVAAASGGEDTAINLELEATFTDPADQRVLDVLITGVPAGGSLSAGTDEGGGNWRMSADELQGLTITPPADDSADFVLTVTAIATNPQSGETMSSQAGFEVTVDGVADMPVVTAVDVAGLEDKMIPLDISAVLADSVGEVLTVQVTGVPDGAILSTGEYLGAGVWSLPPDQLAGLSLRPAPDDSTDMELGLTVTSTEEGTSATVTEQFVVTVSGVADKPIVVVSDVEGFEDTAIGLDISAALADSEGEILLVRIGGVPEGAVLSSGQDLGGGEWALTVDHLEGITLTPAENDSSDIRLSVTVTAMEEGTSAATSRNFRVAISGVADVPVVRVSDAEGLEGTEIPLDVSAALLDPTETLEVMISGIPEGAVLKSGGRKFTGSAGNDTVDVSNWNLETLTITAPEGDDSDFALSVNVMSLETDSNDTASTSAVLEVTVEPNEIVGTEGADTLIGTNDGDVVRGLGGDDIIDTGRGDDVIYAGGGSDTVLTGTGDDTAYGEAGADVITGGSGADQLYGGSGDDVLSGDSGADMLYGGSGDDELSGGARDDTLIGGAGNDILTGGKGRDIFHYDSLDDLNDTITDFKSGSDRLSFDANAFEANYDQETGELDAADFDSVADFDPASPETSAAFVFDQSTENLFYDLSGTGEGYTLVANIENGDLDLSDILMIE